MELISEFSSILNSKKTNIFTSSTGYKCYELNLSDDDVLYILNNVDNIDYVIKDIISRSNDKFIYLLEYENPSIYYNSDKYDKWCNHRWRIDWFDQRGCRFANYIDVKYKICSPYFSTVYNWIDEFTLDMYYCSYEKMYDTFYNKKLC